MLKIYLLLSSIQLPLQFLDVVNNDIISTWVMLDLVFILFIQKCSCFNYRLRLLKMDLHGFQPLQQSRFDQG